VRETSTRRPWRHPAKIASVIVVPLLLTGMALRVATSDVRGGGAYSESAAMPWTGVASQGSYLALTHRSAVSGPFDRVKAAFGLDVEAAPKTPDQYVTLAGVAQTEESRRVGGATDLDQSADAAWAAAHRIAHIPLSGVSSVLNVLTVDESSGARWYRVASGDRVLTINGEPASADAWNRHVERGLGPDGETDPARSVELVVVTRHGLREMLLPIEAGASDGDAPIQGDVGLQVQEITLLATPRPQLVLPRRVTGPSAGIVHTLVFLDALTEGDLTGGMRVAATGTVNSIGRVERIGGMYHKANAAIAAGADVLFVPVANRPEIEEFAGAITIVSVSHVSDAVRWLCANGGTSTACFTTWQNGPVRGIPETHTQLRNALHDRAARAMGGIPRTAGPR